MNDSTNSTKISTRSDERKDAQQPVPFPWDYFALATP